MNSLDLRAPASRVSLPGSPPDLDEAERFRAIAEWQGRMVNEHASARVFAALIAQMMKANIPADFQYAAAAAASEELRHGQLCAGVVQWLGGSAMAPYPDLPDVPGHDDVAPIESLARNVIAISCLNETVAVSLLARGRHRVAVEPLREIVTTILADEVGHARLGWTLLDVISPRLDRPARERLESYLVLAFRQLFGRHFTPSGKIPGAAAQDVGVDDPQETTRMFVTVVDDIIVPGLARHGLDARAAVTTALQRPAAAAAAAA